MAQDQNNDKRTGVSVDLSDIPTLTDRVDNIPTLTDVVEEPAQKKAEEPKAPAKVHKTADEQEAEKKAEKKKRDSMMADPDAGTTEGSQKKDGEITKSMMDAFARNFCGLDEAPEDINKLVKNVDIDKKGVHFFLNNGHKLDLKSIMDKDTKQPVNFIGMERRVLGATKLDSDDAKAIIGVAAMQGWKSVKVHGNTEEKNNLWMEAQRAGLKVTNFIPSEDIQQKWKQEQETKQQIGVSNTEKAPEPKQEEAKAPKQAAPKQEDPEQKAEKKAAPASKFTNPAAAAEKPAAPKNPQDDLNTQATKELNKYLDDRIATDQKIIKGFEKDFPNVSRQPIQVQKKAEEAQGLKQVQEQLKQKQVTPDQATGFVQAHKTSGYKAAANYWKQTTGVSLPTAKHNGGAAKPAAPKQ